MTVMGDAGMEGLSDAGSIPARSTKTEQVGLDMQSLFSRMITVLCVNIIYSAVIFMIWCGCVCENE